MRIAVCAALCLAAAPWAPCQQEAKDVILLVDASAGMAGNYEAFITYLTGPFLQEQVRIGDTFHLVSFAETPCLEISRRIEGVGDIETAAARIMLVYPLAPRSDLQAALVFAANYARSLPPGRGKAMFAAAPPGAAAELQAAAQDFRRQGIPLSLAAPPAPRPPAQAARPEARPKPEPKPAPKPGQPVNIAELTLALQKSPAAAPVFPEPAPAPVPLRPAAPAENPPAQTAAEPAPLPGPPPEPEPLPPEPLPELPPAPAPLPPAVPVTAQPQELPAAPLPAAAPTPAAPESAPRSQTAQESPPILRVVIPMGIVLLVLVGIALVLFAGIGVFAFLWWLRQNPDRTLARRILTLKQNLPPRLRAPASAAESPGQIENMVMLHLFVESQNTAIGRRNIHPAKSGSRFSVGGGDSDFLIFLVPIPPNIAELYFDGDSFTLILNRPEFFPDLETREIRGCIGTTFHIHSEKGYHVRFRFELYEDPLVALNRLLRSIDEE
ncbi:MAG: VWA domain-containing protein [Treponema sp.]|jgi:hypothetical protein|nr:VWA domain-containing protein [Treponema sp.]